MSKAGILTDSQVRFIRKSTLPLTDLATRFGLSRPTISRIKARTLYAHVLDSESINKVESEETEKVHFVNHLNKAACCQPNRGRTIRTTKDASGVTCGRCKTFMGRSHGFTDLLHSDQSS